MSIPYLPDPEKTNTRLEDLQNRNYLYGMLYFSRYWWKMCKRIRNQEDANNLMAETRAAFNSGRWINAPDEVRRNGDGVGWFRRQLKADIRKADRT